MKQSTLPFRQIYLDFHTSPAIPGIGEKFNRAQFIDSHGYVLPIAAHKSEKWNFILLSSDDCF